MAVISSHRSQGLRLPLLPPLAKMLGLFLKTTEFANVTFA